MNKSRLNILVIGFALIATPLLLSFMQTDEKDWTQCLKKSSFKWGGDCKSCTTTSKTYKVWFKNTHHCDQRRGDV